MPELVTNFVPQEQQEQNIETRTAVKRIGGVAIVATTAAMLALFAAVLLYAQSQDNDKYSLKSPGGIAFSDFPGIRGLVFHLFCPHRRKAQGDRWQSDHDQGLQGRHSA